MDKRKFCVKERAHEPLNEIKKKNQKHDNSKNPIQSQNGI